MPDKAADKKRAPPGVLLISGDGGNRTRVRKIRPLNIYKLSQSICVSPPWPRPAGSRERLADGPLKGLLAPHIGVYEGQVGIYDIRSYPDNQRIRRTRFLLGEPYPDTRLRSEGQSVVRNISVGT